MVRILWLQSSISINRSLLVGLLYILMSLHLVLAGLSLKSPDKLVYSIVRVLSPIQA